MFEAENWGRDREMEAWFLYLLIWCTDWNMKLSPADLFYTFIHLFCDFAE